MIVSTSCATFRLISRIIIEKDVWDADCVPYFFVTKTAARLAKAILTYFINEFYCAKNQILVSVVKKIVSKNIKVLHPV